MDKYTDYEVFVEFMERFYHLGIFGENPNDPHNFSLSFNLIENEDHAICGYDFFFDDDGELEEVIGLEWYDED